MKGLELSKLYYEKFGAPMISESFPQIEGRIAVGLCGDGSECLGFDDEVSKDHDFEPSFCMWLAADDFDNYSLALTKAYNSLPKSFMGHERTNVTPTGGARRGVFSVGGFYERFLGSPSAPSSYAHWLSLPEYSLCAAVSGEVFRDDLGEFSKVREELLKGYPEDVRRKKLASAAIIAHQSGIYNYPRCLAHAENGAAQLAVFTFAKNVIAIIYLLNNRYMPFYKWAYRGMKDLEILGDLGDTLTFLTESGNTPRDAEAKAAICTDISRILIGVMREQGLISSDTTDLESAAYEINSKISDPNLRNENIFAGMMRE